MRYRFHTLDVFTDQPFSGNPLAVLPEACGLTAAQMQILAREFNLSETVFILPPRDPAHTHALRIFTPTAELPFAGHPTLGAAWLLTTLGAIPLQEPTTTVVFEEGVGPVTVELTVDRGQPTFARLAAAQLPVQGPTPPEPALLAEVLTLEIVDLVNGEGRPETWSGGVPFLCVPLRDRAALRRARLNQARWAALLADHVWMSQVYPFCGDPADPTQFHVRMFAPALGVAEDPATGAAAVAFAGYLARRVGDKTGWQRWQLTQGEDFGRPSRLTVEADLAEDQLRSVWVGGAAVLMSTGEIDVPEQPA